MTTPQVERIIVIDDEVEIGAAISRMIGLFCGRDGPAVQVATNATDALDLVDQATRANVPLLVISDFNLGGALDGLQILDEVRQLDVRARLVLVTAYAAEELSSRPEFGLLDGFLPKPFRPADLKNVLGANVSTTHAPG